MFEYAVEKYGSDRCALVSTFMMRKSKSAIRDTARILGIDLEYANRAAKLIPTVYYDDDGEKQTDLSIDASIRAVPELQSMYEENPELFDTASRISDVESSASIHAAGMLISPKPLSEYVPIIPTKKGIMATALPLSDAELAGAVKFDFLSLASLSTYDSTQEMIHKFYDFDTIDYEDERVWNLIGSKYTTGLFQISSKTYKSRMGRLKPKSIEELAHCLALLRGPCISSGADMEYIEILEGKRQPDFIHHAYYKVTKGTQGILIYQEQIMELCVEFGFDMESGYVLMKAVAKKKPEKIREWREKFFEQAAKHDATEEQITRMWTMIEDAGAYAFNSGHAVSYAILTYLSAILKTYYPKEFLTNLLTNAFIRDKTEEITEAIEDCRRMGFKFLPPSANMSQYECTIEEGKIRLGLCSIKGFGHVAATEMIEHRPYTSFAHFMESVSKGKCGKRAMIPAIFSNTFLEFGDNQDIYEEFCQLRREEPLDKIKLQSKEEFDVHATDELKEKLILRGNFTTAPSNSMPSFGFHDLKKDDTFTTEGIVVGTKKHKTKNGKTMAFVELATGDGHLEIVLFPAILDGNAKYVRKNSRLHIKAKKDGLFSCVGLSILN